MSVTVASNVARHVFRSVGRERVGNGVVSVTVASSVPRLVFRSVGRESGQWCRVSHCAV